MALYQAKDQGRNRVIRFTPEMWSSKKMLICTKSKTSLDFLTH
jgi:hypothetical protein